MIRHANVIVHALIAAAVTLLASSSPLAQTKPRVPIGIDPGGVAVAIVADSGIDYTTPQIAARVARDGEGELVGWDFIDNDRKPYAAASAGGMSALATALLADAPGARIAPFRARPADKIQLGKAAVYVARSPAKIALFTLSTSSRSDWDAFEEVLTHFKDVLVVVPVGPGQAAFPASLELSGLLRVAAKGDLSGNIPSPADIAIPAAAGEATTAAARVAALAARLTAAEPQLKGADLKARIVSFAKPLPPPHEKKTVHGWIADPLNPSAPR